MGRGVTGDWYQVAYGGCQRSGFCWGAVGLVFCLLLTRARGTPENSPNWTGIAMVLRCAGMYRGAGRAQICDAIRSIIVDDGRYGS